MAFYISVSCHELVPMLVGSFYDCLRRESTECVSWLIRYWMILHPYHALIKQDVQGAIIAGRAGDADDVHQWNKILELK
jgi:hypothetical protein